jgi:CRP-like cAMP-binding protein
MLPAPVLEGLARALVRRVVPGDEVVVREGESGDRFYLVAAGRLAVSTGGARVGTLGPGDGFGEIALLRDGLRTATVTTCGPATLYALGRAPFLEAVTGSHHARRAAEELVTQRLESAPG